MKRLIYALLLGTMAAVGFTLGIQDWRRPPPQLEAELSRAAVDPSQVLVASHQQLTLQGIQALEALAQLSPLAESVSLPFDYVGRHILVSTQIHDLGTTRTLIFDSGLRSTVLDQDVVPQQALATPIQVDGQSVYGLLQEVSLGGANFHNVGAFAVEFSAPGHPLYCLSDSGVIGANWMRHGIWQIDYQHHRLTVAESVADLDDVSNAMVIPFDLVDFTPVIDLQVGSHQTVKVLVDTGWDGSIHLTAEDFRALSLGPLQEASTIEGLVETLGGLEIFNQKLLRIPALSIGSLRLENFPVLVSYGEHAQPYSRVGNEFLENFIVTLDWVNQRLYLKPIAPVSELYPNPPAYGFQSIVYDHRLLITGVYHPSPAAQAGLQIGDRILAIDRDRYTHFSNEHGCSFVYSPLGDRYTGPITMTVERQGSPLTYTLSPTPAE
ncbi:MAG TPA: aspartyl protease family protein [Leptolyngbyaceae cyanobacterium M65_K2018_010]|nr:aspartyl protease family protein [Leptolyngbyaceae cyanobacterium M65_K2018_010]